MCGVCEGVDTQTGAVDAVCRVEEATRHILADGHRFFLAFPPVLCPLSLCYQLDVMRHGKSTTARADKPTRTSIARRLRAQDGREDAFWQRIAFFSQS